MCVHLSWWRTDRVGIFLYESWTLGQIPIILLPNLIPDLYFESIFIWQEQKNNINNIDNFVIYIESRRFAMQRNGLFNWEM